MNVNRLPAVMAILVVFAVWATGLAQESMDSAAGADMGAAASVSDSPAEADKDTQWVWGEVVAVDKGNKTVTLKYLDYETDQEKGLVLAVDEKTKFENVDSLDKIRVKDSLSVDYAPVSEDMGTARNISLENVDDVDMSDSSLPAQAAVATPGMNNPVADSVSEPMSAETMPAAEEAPAESQ